MKKLNIIIAALVMVCTLSGCGSAKMLLDAESKLDSNSIDKIQIVLAMGNPEYGADSKILTSKDEIKEMFDAFNNATIGGEVKDGDIHVSAPSSYYFYSGGSLVRQFMFNGNNTERIWFNSKCFYIEYPDKSPYEIYQHSNAKIITVDEELNEMKVAEQVEDVPVMLLGYTVNGKPYEVNVSSGGSRWRFDNGDGTFTEALADAPHSLDMLGVMPVIDKVDGLKGLNISFTLSPDSYTVRRWVDDYAGNTQEHANDFEPVEVSEGAIAVADDAQGYIYEVNAVWAQGNANYTFAVSLS